MKGRIFDALMMLCCGALGAGFGWTAVLGIAFGAAISIFVVIPFLDRRH